MGSLSRTVRLLTCSCSSASSPRPWPPPSSTPPTGRTATQATTQCLSTPALPTQALPTQSILASSRATIPRWWGQWAARPRTGVVKFGNFLEINGVFEQVATATATVPMTIVKGNFNIQQNGILDIFSGADAKITAYIMSSTDLTGKNVKLHIGTGADCVAAMAAGPTEVAMVNAPPSINGFYINGRTEGFNIDGMNGKTSLMGANKWLIITESGTIIGCSKTALQ